MLDSAVSLPRSDRHYALESIFEPFGRAANATASNLPGMGLGLFLCRAVVGGLGGTLALASGPPLGGARVTLRVPILERGGA